MKPRATCRDVYDHLSFQEWKAFLEIRKELEREGKSADHLRGVIYIHLSRWEREGYIASREMALDDPKCKHGVQRREYLKVSYGIPEEFRGIESLLGRALQPTCV